MHLWRDLDGSFDCTWYKTLEHNLFKLGAPQYSLHCPLEGLVCSHTVHLDQSAPRTPRIGEGTMPNRVLRTHLHHTQSNQGYIHKYLWYLHWNLRFLCNYYCILYSALQCVPNRPRIPYDTDRDKTDSNHLNNLTNKLNRGPHLMSWELSFHIHHYLDITRNERCSRTLLSKHSPISRLPGTCR